MKNKCNSIRLFLASLLLLCLGACQKEQTQEHRTNPLASGTWYTCPMPEDSVFSQTPGTCPKCGMDLELIPAQQDTLALLVQPTNQVVLSRLLPILPSRNHPAHSVPAEGYLTYDPNNATTLSARADGRIEKLWVRSNFQEVTKGQLLLELYSAELQTAQSEYLYAFTRSMPADQTTLSALKIRLGQLGMADEAIKELETTGKIHPTTRVLAPMAGHVHFLNAPQDISSHAFGIATTPNNTSAMKDVENAPSVKEGDYVRKGDLLFTIANATQLWALLKVKPADLAMIHPKDSVQLQVYGKVLQGRVEIIEPSFQDFATVRVHVRNSNHAQLKIGSLVSGIIHVGRDNSPTLWVPTLSVVALGRSRFVAFVKQGGAFHAKAIKIGLQSDQWTEVVQGLSPTDSIAPVAAYLVDSESSITTK